MPVTQQTNRQVGGLTGPPKQGPDSLEDPGPSRHPPAVSQAAGSSSDAVANDIRTLENMLVDASTLVLPPDPTAAHEFLVNMRQKLVEMSVQIVKNFKNGVKDLDEYGCSPRFKRWIAELAHDMDVNGPGPRPLDMKMIKKPPPVVSVVSAGRPPIMGEDESEVEGTRANVRRKGKRRLVERPGGREGEGSMESGGMEIDGTVRKRKTPQRVGEDEDEDIPLAEKVPPKKRKVTGRPRDEVGEDVHNDETHEKASTTVRHRNSTDGIDRRVQVIDGASFFVVPCRTWCSPNNQLCGAGSGPKIACDHCRKRKAPCDKSVKKKRVLADNGEPSSKGEIKPKKGQSAGKKGKVVQDEKEGGVVPGPRKQRDVRERTTVVHGGTSGPVPQAAPDPGKGESDGGADDGATLWSDVSGKGRLILTALTEPQRLAALEAISRETSTDNLRPASRVSTQEETAIDVDEALREAAKRVCPVNDAETMVEMQDVIAEVALVKAGHRSLCDDVAEMKGHLRAVTKEVVEVDVKVVGLKDEQESTNDVAMATRQQVDLIQDTYPERFTQLMERMERIDMDLAPRVNEVERMVKENHGWTLARLEALEKFTNGELVPKLSECSGRDHDALAQQATDVQARLAQDDVMAPSAENDQTSADVRMTDSARDPSTPGRMLGVPVDSLVDWDSLRGVVREIKEDVGAMKEEMRAQFRALQASVSQANLVYETLSACLRLSEIAIRHQYRGGGGREETPATPHGV